MGETKYGKYFITETPPNPSHPQGRNREGELEYGLEHGGVPVAKSVGGEN